MRNRRRVVYLSCFLATFLMWQTMGFAHQEELPKSLVASVLSETQDRAFRAIDFEGSEFDIEWLETKAEENPFKAEILPNSVEWIRVGEGIRIPRARVRISSVTASSALVRYAGFTTPMLKAEKLEAEISVALLSDASNRIEIVTPQKNYIARIKYKGASAVAVDAFCSLYRVQLDLRCEGGSSCSPNWASVGCRTVHVKTDQGVAPSLEAYLIWDGVEGQVDVGGVPTHSARESLWPLRLISGRHEVEFRSGSRIATLKYEVPNRDRAGHLGIGLGPYTYHFEGADKSVATMVPLLTLYGSYNVLDSFRIVAFDATAIHRDFYSDFGLYLHTLSFRAFDNRISMSLMLGGHALIFESRGAVYMKPSIPQGIEFTARDLGIPRFNGSFGLFYYPEINHTAYTNLWLRYGTSRYFLELNFISWRDKTSDDPTGRYFNRAFGLSFGMPLIAF